MSEKIRQKKDGQNKTKRSQARRAAEQDSRKKQTKSTGNHAVRRAESRADFASEEPITRQAPSAARAHASKADKGK